MFFLSSSLMAIILGAALGNVIRGVPLDATGFFRGPLFTNFRIGAHPGALDWYTVLIGVFTLCALAAHGSTYLVWKTTARLRERAQQAGCVLWTAVTLLLIPTTIATAAVQPVLYGHLLSRPATWLLAVLAFGSLAAVIAFRRQQWELPAFLASAAFLVGLLGATASGIYPNLLVSTLNPSDSLDIYRSAAGGIGMRIGLLWWTPAILLALGYFTYLFHSFRGKVEPANEGHGY